jgi:hypothetical protein
MDPVEPEPRAAPRAVARWGFVALGSSSLLAALPASLFAFVYGSIYLVGWHGVVPQPLDRVCGVAILALPLLLIALAFVSFRCALGRQPRARVAAVAAAFLFDAALVVLLLQVAR